MLLATLGTFVVVYGGVASSNEPPIHEKPSATAPSIKPSAPLLGDILSLIASFACGLYTVLYKMYAALPSNPELMAERLAEDEETLALVPSESLQPKDTVYPPPFGLHSNLITSFTGFFTFVILWIPLPFLHWSGAEVFRLPPDWRTAVTIGSIALSGMCFNAGYMVKFPSYR